MKQVKEIIKNCTGKILDASPESVKKKIDKNKVISFDIFDTLVKRNVYKPTDVFLLVEKKYNLLHELKIKEFHTQRIQAEQRARELSAMEEVTLDDIYTYLKLSDTVKQELYQLEIQMEIDNCVPNISMKEIYDYALKKRKHIVITSDMYLPEKVIKEILSRCGYIKYEKLYLSSVYKKTKSKGSIFEVILNEYNLYDRKILHIGDHINGDYIQPRKHKIQSLIIDGNKNHLIFHKKVKDSLDYRSMCSVINNCMGEETSLVQKIGYEVVGPMLYGFCMWLNEQIEKDNIDKIFFLSREGKLIQKAYQTLFPDSDIPQTYLKVSRQSLIVPRLSDSNSFDEMMELLKIFLHVPILKTIAEVCSFDCVEFNKELNIVGLSENDNIYSLNDNMKDKVFQIVCRMGKAYVVEQKKYVLQYLEQEDYFGKVAIVDIGWSGTMQRCLNYYRSDNVEVIGYYFGVNNLAKEEFCKDIVRKGYLFEPDRLNEYSKIRFTLQVFESLFLNTDGSVCKYDFSHDNVKPILLKLEYSKSNADLIGTIQDSAIEFLNRVFICRQRMKVTVDDLMNVYTEFALRPSLKVLELFRDFKFLDGSIIFLLPQKSIWYYMCHLRKFERDLNANVCKVWFFKWLFKLKFPYYYVLKFASDCGMKSKFMKESYVKNSD